MTAVAGEHGAHLPEDVIVAGGAQGAEGHNEGSGPLRAGDAVVVDIWPQDRASRCWADMTRTFVAGGGDPDDELAEYWRLCRESLARVHPMVRAGADANAIFRASCEPFIAAGKPTQITKTPGEVLRDGYFHSLGHGVGLEVHERPHLSRVADTLVAGDVIAVEPGCYRQGYGGCRLEDLVLVTDDGGEILTDFPYDL
jgi:Xaa-Pro aminopeptidase